MLNPTAIKHKTSIKDRDQERSASAIIFLLRFLSRTFNKENMFQNRLSDISAEWI